MSDALPSDPFPPIEQLLSEWAAPAEGRKRRPRSPNGTQRERDPSHREGFGLERKGPDLLGHGGKNRAPVTLTTRNCLGCERPFESTWFGNRLCDRCREGNGFE